MRCSKLELKCVVDKNHKRTSRRSKLEELAAEVQTIKDAVAPRPLLQVPHVADLTPPVRSGPVPVPVSVQLPSPLQVPPASTDSYLPAPSNFFTRPRPYSISAESAVLTPSRSDAASSGQQPRTAEPRALGSRVFSGEDIDYYFEKWLLLTPFLLYHLLTNFGPGILNIFTPISPSSGCEIQMCATKEDPSSSGPPSWWHVVGSLEIAPFTSFLWTLYFLRYGTKCLSPLYD